MSRGSKAGERRGGRGKGTPNKKTVLRQELADKALSEGLKPLDFFLQVMRDPKQPLETRLLSAKEAAPYCHPKLASTSNGFTTEPFKVVINHHVTEDKAPNTEKKVVH